MYLRSHAMFCSQPPQRRAQNSRRRQPFSAPAPQYSLLSLVAELQRRAQTEPQGDVISWLYALSKGLDLRIRYDEWPATGVKEPATGVKGPATGSAANATFVGDAETIRKKTSTAFRRGKQIPYSIVDGRMVLHFDDPALLEHDPPPSGHFGHLASENKFVGRIIISCGRRVDAHAPPLCVESNGAVIDARTWRLLAVPPRAFTTRCVDTEIDRILSIPDADGEVRTGGYDIIKVNDGTVVTLYSWAHPTKGPIWCLASSNGYDVSHLKWMGEKPYAELVYELLAVYPKFVAASGLELLRDHLCENDVRLGFARLDPRHCYTIGFRHPNFHPLRIDPPGVWTIQITDPASANRQPSSVFSLIPHQVLYTRGDINDLAAAGGRLIGPRLAVADLEFVLKPALENAKEAIAGGRGGVIHYGFILHSRLTPAADVLCESPLLQQVRRFVYQRPSRQIREELTETTRLNYYAFKAFLSRPVRKEFLALFPEYISRFKGYETFISETIDQVLFLARSCSRPTYGGEKPCSSSSGDNAAQIVARTMFAHIQKHAKSFNTHHPDARYIIDRFITRPEYASLYLLAISSIGG